MIVRPWAEFTSDLPDDQIEDDEDITQYGGKSVAAAIGEMLTRYGCKVSEPIYAEEHGWELDITIGKRPLWAQVTLIEGYLLLIEQNSWWANLRRRYWPEYLDILKRLSEDLAVDGRFHDVRWGLTGDDVLGGGGYPSPIAD